MTVMRQSDVSRHEEDDLLPFIPEKSVKQRLQVMLEIYCIATIAYSSVL